MRPISLTIAALAAALAAASPAFATITYVSSELYASAYAPTAADKTETVTAAALPTTALSLSEHVSSDNFANAGGSAGFTDDTAGLLTFGVVDAHANYDTVAKVAAGVLRFKYTFTVDTAYLARLTYNLVLDPESEVSFGIFPGDPLNPALTSLPGGDGDLFSDGFGPGTYTLEIVGRARAQPTAQDPSKTVTTLGTVGFLLLPNGRTPSSPTPEPAAWAMMILGLAATGAALRRRATRPAMA